MPHGDDTFIPTRRSLLSRLRNWDDQESWRQFFETYEHLIYSVARKAGLTEPEAQDVVQETVISVAKTMPDFKYDPAKCAFKSWLRHLTKRRIADQFRKRQKRRLEVDQDDAKADTEVPLEEIADPNSQALDTLWDAEFEQHLFEAAVERVKEQVSSEQFQIFDFRVRRQKSVAEIASLLHVNPARVYLITHRVLRRVKAQVKTLRQGVL